MFPNRGDGVHRCDAVAWQMRRTREEEEGKGEKKEMEDGGVVPLGSVEKGGRNGIDRYRDRNRITILFYFFFGKEMVCITFCGV